MIKSLFFSAVLFSLAACDHHQDIGSCGGNVGCIQQLEACDGLNDGDACSLNGAMGSCDSGGCVTPDGATCTPSVEICNGLDDDCDGLVDEGLNCNVCADHPDGDACVYELNGLTHSGACDTGICVDPPDVCTGHPDGDACTMQLEGAAVAGNCLGGSCIPNNT